MFRSPGFYHPSLPPLHCVFPILVVKTPFLFSSHFFIDSVRVPAPPSCCRTGKSPLSLPYPPPSFLFLWTFFKPTVSVASPVCPLSYIRRADGVALLFLKKLACPLDVCLPWSPLGIVVFCPSPLRLGPGPCAVPIICGQFGEVPFGGPVPDRPPSHPRLDDWLLRASHWSGVILIVRSAHFHRGRDCNFFLLFFLGVPLGLPLFACCFRIFSPTDPISPRHEAYGLRVEWPFCVPVFLGLCEDVGTFCFGSLTHPQTHFSLLHVRLRFFDSRKSPPNSFLVGTTSQAVWRALLCEFHPPPSLGFPPLR